MAWSNELPDPAVDAALPVTLEVQAQDYLYDEENLQDMCESSVYVPPNELTSSMRVTEEETKESEGRTEDLCGDVPSRFRDLVECVRREIGEPDTVEQVKC